MKALKIIAVSLILFSISNLVAAQADSTFYKVKIDRYQSWQRTGTIVMISGAAVEAAGIGLLIRAMSLPPDKNDDAAFGTAYGIMGIGIATIIPGIIFHGIGKRKTKEYQIRLNDIRTSFYYTPHHSGIVLTYRF